MDRISPYKAKHGGQFEVRNPFGRDMSLGSARGKLAALIDSSWKYSWHWPEDHNTWLDKAQSDLLSEVPKANERLKDLENAQRISMAIDREEHDIKELH